jgi:ParB-like nuclease family protein
MKLALCSIRTDGGTQPRETIDFVTVADYADDMRAGALFPPVVVFNDGADYWLADGFHRIQAAAQAGIDEIAADVRQGTQQDAQWYSYSVNQSHGLRRTNEDKRRAVDAALQHEYASRYSNVQIAKHCGVDEGTVRKYRDLSSEFPKIDNAPRLVLPGAGRGI